MHTSGSTRLLAIHATGAALVESAPEAVEAERVNMRTYAYVEASTEFDLLKMADDGGAFVDGLGDRGSAGPSITHPSWRTRSRKPSGDSSACRPSGSTMAAR